MNDFELSWQFTKYLDERATVSPRAHVDAPYTDYVIDYLIELGCVKVGFVCDHLASQTERILSGFRDALLVDAGYVHVLYRFSTQDLEERFQDCMLLVAKWNPDLFSTRGRMNLEMLASWPVLNFRPLYNLALMQVPVGYLAALKDEDQYESSINVVPALVFRRIRHAYPLAWKGDYEQALSYYGVSRAVTVDRE